MTKLTLTLKDHHDDA